MAQPAAKAWTRPPAVNGDLVDLINRANVRVMQRRRGLGRAEEAFLPFVIEEQVIGEELERDAGLQGRAFGLVDHAHAALAELLDDAVVADS